VINVIYCCDIKAVFSASLLQSSVNWSFRSHDDSMLKKKHWLSMLRTDVLLRFWKQKNCVKKKKDFLMNIKFKRL